MSDTPILDKSREIVGKLDALLKDPHPGLFTWQGFVHELTAELHELINGSPTMPDTTPAPDLPSVPPPMSEEELKAIELVLTEGRYFVGNWSAEQLKKLLAEVRRLRDVDAKISAASKRPIDLLRIKHWLVGPCESIGLAVSYVRQLFAEVKRLNRELLAARAAVAAESQRADRAEQAGRELRGFIAKWQGFTSMSGGGSIETDEILASTAWLTGGNDGTESVRDV